MGNALAIGISGLNASSRQIDIAGNNIANVNTMGFKVGRIFFSNILAESLSGGSGAMQAGRGVQVAAVSTSFETGTCESTGTATDLFVDGEGFFIVKGADGAICYTRAGAFHIDKDGYLVDVNNYKVQGYNFFGSSSATVGDIPLKNVQSSPSPTTAFSVGLNLNASTAAAGTFNSTQTVYDSLGTAHDLAVTFMKTENSDAAMWSFIATLDGTAATTQVQSGLKFDAGGDLDKVYTSTATETVTNTASDGTVTSPLTVPTPADITDDDTLVLTRGATADLWTTPFTANYPAVNVCSSSDTEIGIDLDGDTIADVTATLANNWTTGDVITVTLTAGTGATGVVTNNPGGTDGSAALTINNTGQLYKDTGADDIILTRGATASDWTINTDSAYASAEIIGITADSKLLLDLDGVGGADITVTLSGNWTTGDKITVDINQTETTAVDVNLTFNNGDPLAGGATIGDTGVISWNLVGSGAETITGYASTSVVRALSNDGYSSGILKTLSFEKDGIITGFFTNGQTTQLGQVVLADFACPWGLKKLGDNLFGETLSSGEVVRNIPGAAGLGEIISSSLEMSNTDIATEFINLISAQRAYQACAKIVTTADQMLAELMNIKR